ncbi:MAG: putative DNA binding domain-containing protein [Planctomycetes bacterium]|nr:putative DNA binding domain-containing protein [Planctomycetota bacterium]
MSYSDAELEALARDLESDGVERKRSLSDKDRVAQAVCAFANDMPDRRRAGIVFLGLDDAGNPAGTPIDDRLLLDLAGIRADGRILPLPVMTVEKRRLFGSDIAVVIVRPHNDPPVRYDGRVWIRVGPRRAIASRDEERILVERRQAADLPFDKRPVRGSTSADLDLSIFTNEYLPRAIAAETLAENDRSIEHQLAALHLTSRDGTPNAAAILLFGRDPRYWLPGAYVQFARFQGRSVTDPIADQKTLTGTVPNLLRRADDLAAANNRVATEVAGHLTEVRAFDYPPDALRQLLANAVMHRNYETSHAPVTWYQFDDRIEVHSPGGLFGQVHEENFGRPGASDCRNPTLAEGLKVLGFVQRFGMGIPLARKLCQGNGNPPPGFAFDRTSVSATLRRRLGAISSP